MIIVRYAEIGLKGKNRVFFERMLVDNIQRKIKCTKVSRPRGRILVDTEVKNIKALDKIFGISSYSVAKEIDWDIEVIKKECFKVIKKMEFNSFKVNAQRLDKTYHIKSPDINKEVGAYIVEKMEKEVDLTNPDVEINIEIVNKKAYVYSDKIEGLKGLPVGVSGNVLSLLSGGIDSPVSSLLLMKRGCKVNFIHFHNYPYVKKQSLEKVKELFNIVKEFENKTKLFLVPFTDVQKEIVSKCSSKLRILLYRRVMLKIAEKVAHRNKCKALITGENLAQVSSQTLMNMSCVAKSTGLLMLRPLVGMDKSDIIELAQKYGTYEKSIEPHDDCCTFFVPKHPETNAKMEDVLADESKIDVDAMVEECLKNIEVFE